MNLAPWAPMNLAPRPSFVVALYVLWSPMPSPSPSMSPCLVSRVACYVLLLTTRYSSTRVASCLVSSRLSFVLSAKPKKC